MFQKELHWLIFNILMGSKSMQHCSQKKKKIKQSLYGAVQKMDEIK